MISDYNHDRVRIEIQRMDWARNLDEDTIFEIAAASELVHFQAGQIALDLDASGNYLLLIIEGRVEGQIYDRLGKKVLHEIRGRGAVIGMFSIAIPEKAFLRVEVIEPTIALRMTLENLLRLTAKFSDFQRAMFYVAANIVKKLVLIDRDLPKPPVIGLVHHSIASRELGTQLARRLHELNESPCVAADDQQWKPATDIPFRLIIENGKLISQEQENQQLKEWVGRGRLFVHMHAHRPHEEISRLLGYSDIILWCIRPQDAAFALERLKSLIDATPRLREKIRIVWILDYESPFPPYITEIYEYCLRDFKIHWGEPRPNQGKLLRQGIERIVHHLRGIHVGLALGGGAARGMAHLGVLKSLEENGIFVDMLAGTSAGAMTGMIHASGLDPDYVAQCFKTDLQPSWLFKCLPGSGYWYLLYKYRSNQFDRMLRRYLHDLRAEQLAIPIITVAVDLIEGAVVVREVGDATHNILESINLPPLALPIIQSSQAVVDGGLLNNVPANLLVEKGCNFVIASTVTAKLEKDFMGIRSQKGTRKRRFFSSIRVIMRQNMIQRFSMNSVGIQPADFVIAPDVTAFDLSEFTRADEMALVGENTTKASIQQLKVMLSKLDPQLFG